MYRCVVLVLIVSLGSCKRPEYPSGQAVYEEECVKCHKLNGEGGTKGPDLTSIFREKDEVYFRKYTMDPRSFKSDGTMPPSKISDRELDLVVQYVKEKGRRLGEPEKQQ